ncbi:nucleoside deaminase [Desulforegula conservatrix]|uniref:nucleoside deaminase n=1 Tax=Desulforegula conservatrix TaxID=153026 RepID=UPI000486E1B0|nr:nucleoside deaminase [Desulforegula conservatrix]
MNHEEFMAKALKNAEKALESGEFPVGCVIIENGRIISSSTRTSSRQSAGGETRHAEIIALENLEKDHPGADRKNLTLYCTLEPCLMCFGAIIISGIKKMVYAYEDTMGGGTSCILENLPPLYRDSGIQIVPGIMRNESLQIFKKFFSSPSNDYLKDSLLAKYTLETI